MLQWRSAQKKCSGCVRLLDNIDQIHGADNGWELDPHDRGSEAVNLFVRVSCDDMQLKSELVAITVICPYHTTGIRGDTLPNLEIYFQTLTNDSMKSLASISLHVLGFQGTQELTRNTYPRRQSCVNQVVVLLLTSHISGVTTTSFYRQ